MSLTFEEQVALTYLNAALGPHPVQTPTAERLNGTPAPVDPDSYVAWLGEAHGRLCALQADAFVRGFNDAQALEV